MRCLSATDPQAIAAAAQRLREGQLVAFPTETVYGLGAHALQPEAVARIYAAKGRPAHNPIIVHVADVAAAQALVAEWTPHAERLARRWWPGPLTLVLRKASSVPDSVTAGLPKVGVRVPAHPVALALLQAAQVPVAAPSANRSNEVSPTCAAHVVRSLGEADVWVLDGGDCSVGIESTVVDVSGATPVLLRPGGISRAALEQELGVPVSVAAPAARDDEARAAPGMLRKHYAPQASVRLVPHGQATLLRATALQLAAQHGVVMQRVAVLASHATLQQAELQDCVQLVASADPVVYARELYAHLHSVDERGCQVLVLESVPALAAWDAVRDRLQRAAAQAEAT